jgi:hypothetical protein
MGVNHHKLLHVYLITVDLLAMAFSFLVAASTVVPEVDGVPFTQFFSIRISILNVLFWGLLRFGISCWLFQGHTMSGDD